VSGSTDPDEVWLVLTGRFSARLFFDTGIVDRLRGSLGDRLVVVLLCSDDRLAEWADRIGDRCIWRSELEASSIGPLERAVAGLDGWLDRRVGYYPLALRLNQQYGFFVERMRPGHPIPYLDVSQSGLLPRGQAAWRVAHRWTFGPWRHVPSGLRGLFRDRCRTLLLGTVQGQPVIPFMTAARRYRRSVVGYVASWDHTVGKGVISPHLDRYVVQNGQMQDDLERYHRIVPERVAVTGWPLTDVFARALPRSTYESFLRQRGLDPERPVILYSGNTPGNAPYEGALVARLLEWLRERQYGLIVRPHPIDGAWRDRFGDAIGQGAYLQEPSYADVNVLTMLLQHVDCVVSNAGTILLEAVVNDRPAVCVLFDEGAPPGERWAELNVVGRHYRELVEAGAFPLARSFDDLAAGVERALADPSELRPERGLIARRIVGEADGLAAERVADAMLSVVD